MTTTAADRQALRDHLPLYRNPDELTHTPGICLTCRDIKAFWGCDSCGTTGTGFPLGKVAWCGYCGWQE
jgi:hypothetical protein